MNTQALTDIFTKFAGRQVNVTTKSHGKKIETLIDENDPAVAELIAAVQAAGFQLRLWTKGSFGTMDYRTDRVNVDIKADNAGVYRMGRFRLG